MTTADNPSFAPLNQWYVAAFSHEVGRQPIERWVLDEPVAMYRTEGGRPVAVEGRCPHHYFPLGKSGLVGDNLRCGYHGMTFGPDGQCLSMPTVAKVPAACSIKAYPLVERWQWIWIWPGDPALADEALLPDHDAALLTNPQYDTRPLFHYEVAAGYQLIHDNLLDLTHIEFLHEATIGTDKVGITEEERKVDDRSIDTRRVIEDIPIPPQLRDRMSNFEGRVDREFGLTFHLPCLHAGYETYRGGTSSDHPGKSLGTAAFYHAITPARRNTTHYFFARGRDYDLGNQETTEQARVMLEKVLREDMFATEQVERMMSQSTHLPPERLVASDKTLMLGRRLMEKMIRDDKPPQRAAAAA